MKLFLRKLISFFDKADRKKFLMLLPCILLMGLIEMCSVATILPFLAVVAKPEYIETNSYLNFIYTSLGFEHTRSFIFFLGTIVFSALLAGNLFSAFTSWCMMRFCYNQGSKISSRLFNIYIKQPFSFFLNRNTGDLQKNILSEVERLVSGVLNNGCLILSRCTVVACILILLILIDFKLALIVSVVIGGTYFCVYTFVRKKLSVAGQLSSSVDGERYRITKEVISAIKELKALNRLNMFEERFQKISKTYAHYESISQITPLLIRYMIEMIAFGGMLVIALYLIGTKEDLSLFLPMIGLYALAGFRLLPAAQQLFSGITLIRYNAAAVDILYSDYLLSRSTQTSNAPLMKLNKHLNLNNICFSYPNAKKLSLDNLSLSIKNNSTIGIVGTSGAGKTTLVDIILGLLEPLGGEIIVDGQKITADNVSGWQKNIGYVPQNIYLLDKSIKANIALGIEDEEIDFERVEKSAKLANLHDFISQELPSGYDTTVGESGVRLSGGQRQRIGIARALYHDPQLIIFDEATSALDNITEQIIMEAISCLAHQKTIIIIAHRLQTVKNCDLIYFMSNGEIIDKGDFASLMKSNNEFRILANLAG